MLIDGRLQAADVAIDAGVICAQGGRQVDLSGCVLLPGIIDPHGDGFDRHIAPRRGLVRNPAEGLPMLAAELAACGITTAYLAQFWSWEGGMRGPEFARALADSLAKWAGAIDLRMQLRVETHMLADFNAISRFVRAANLDYVVFNDHLPHATLARGVVTERLTSSALRARRSPEVHLQIMCELAANGPQVGVALARLIAEMPPIRFGSHDDSSLSRRVGFAELGATIAEFPTVVEAAVGDVVLGAPNVVRGGSHGGGMSAAEVIAAGRCSALASDYHYPAPLLAVRRMVAQGAPLTQVWRLVSGGPAAMLGLSDRGDIAVGKRADLVALDRRDLSLVATFASGRPVWMRDDLAARLLG